MGSLEEMNKEPEDLKATFRRENLVSSLHSGFILEKNGRGYQCEYEDRQIIGQIFTSLGLEEIFYKEDNILFREETVRSLGRMCTGIRELFALKELHEEADSDSSEYGEGDDDSDSDSDDDGDDVAD